MNINTTDKVQVREPVTGTSTGTSTIWHCPYTQPKAEQGWECPRCGHINAPWVRQCDCSRSNWTITSDWTYKPEWMKEVTGQGTKIVLDSDTFQVHPDSITYQVGGSDYWNPTVKEWKNVDVNTSNTIHTGKTNYKE